MHFFYAAVVGVDCRDSCLLTGKLHTLGTAEVTSIAGLQSTEGKKKGKGRKEKKAKIMVSKSEVGVYLLQMPGDGEGTG